MKKKVQREGRGEGGEEEAGRKRFEADGHERGRRRSRHAQGLIGWGGGGGVETHRLLRRR